MRNLRVPRRVAVLALAVIAVAAGVAGALVARDGGDPETAVPEAGNQSPGQRRASFLARVIPPPPDPRGESAGTGVPKSVRELAGRLPLERKVAQLFLLGFEGQDLNGPIFRQFRRFDVGGMVIGPDNYTDPQQLALLAGEAAVISRQERNVPPWVMGVQEGGEFNSFPDLPPPTAAADLPDVNTAVTEAEQAGGTLKPLGVNGVLGPVIDVGLAEDPALGPRAFSDEPDRVATYARGVVEAYRRTKVFAAAKHFPGLGSAPQSTEEGPANVGLSVAELRKRDLVPFRAAIEAGVPGVIVGHGLYATDDFVTPASLSRRVTTGLLKRELDFKGIAIADDLADPPISALAKVPDAAVTALKAGADMLYISGSAGDQQAAYVAVLRAARSREIPRERLDDAVLRILSVKRDYGLIR
jgi:beta-N-acetylhexosaminidase